jgi:hypothetical protein
LEYWKNGGTGKWATEELAVVVLPNIPSFQPSIIPAFYYSIISNGCDSQRQYLL